MQTKRFTRQPLLFLLPLLGFGLLTPLLPTRADDSKDDSTATIQETEDWIVKNQCSPSYYDKLTLTFKDGHMTFVTAVPLEHTTETNTCRLEDLNPDRVGLMLCVTDDRKSIMNVLDRYSPDSPKTTETTYIAKMDIPFSELSLTVENIGRWHKAWKHLIRLSGGKPSKKEPF